MTPKFSFISPSLLVIVVLLLALLPIALLLASKRHAVCRAAVWHGGAREDIARVMTTALTFYNALRTFYSFNYRPTEEITRESRGREYFITRLEFTRDTAPVFGPYLFAPAVRLVRASADKLRVLQSGHLNFYPGLIGLLLVIILAVTLL
jgi:hydrogenase-4 component B